jgi:hypothetical protein
VSQLTEMLNPINDRFERQYIVDCALMGATDQSGKNNKDATKCACLNGACFLWGIQQVNRWEYVNTSDKNNKLKMLGGAGEVTKGSFVSK